MNELWISTSFGSLWVGISKLERKFSVSRQTLPAVAAEKLSDLHGLADDYDIVGIDEGQFVSVLNINI